MKGAGFRGTCGIPSKIIPTSWNRPGHLLDSELLDFLVVVLAVEDVPFLAALEDGALLAFDLLAGSGVDLGFGLEHLFQDAADFQADTVAVLDELHPLLRGQGVRDGVRQLVELVAAEPQTGAALDLWESHHDEFG